MIYTLFGLYWKLVWNLFSPKYFGLNASPNMCLLHFKVSAFLGKFNPYVSARLHVNHPNVGLLELHDVEDAFWAFLSLYILLWKAASKLPRVNKSNSKRFEFSLKRLAHYFWLGSELGSAYSLFLPAGQSENNLNTVFPNWFIDIWE